jgi:hypothetical protein
LLNSLVKLSDDQRVFLTSVRTAMEAYFGADRRRIDHALQVFCYARELLAYIDADPVLTLAAAYLHDIGIPEAERKHGSSSGKWQELEGPAVATALLQGLAADEALTTRIAAIVGSHHTPAAIDSPEFRIIWDADALVNFAEVVPSKSAGQIEAMLEKHMVTEAGFRIGRRIFLPATESHKRCLEGHRPYFLEDAGEEESAR